MKFILYFLIDINYLLRIIVTTIICDFYNKHNKI